MFLPLLSSFFSIMNPPLPFSQLSLNHPKPQLFLALFQTPPPPYSFKISQTSFHLSRANDSPFSFSSRNENPPLKIKMTPFNDKLDHGLLFSARSLSEDFLLPLSNLENLSNTLLSMKERGSWLKKKLMACMDWFSRV